MSQKIEELNAQASSVEEDIHDISSGIVGTNGALYETLRALKTRKVDELHGIALSLRAMENQLAQELQENNDGRQ
jgi:hypothetical protein